MKTFHAVRMQRRRKWTLRERFWAMVCRFAYRRCTRRGIIPTGLPGHRDPESKCDQYFPVLKPSGRGPCESDGHYLCAGCEWITAARLAEIQVMVDECQ